MSGSNFDPKSGPIPMATSSIAPSTASSASIPKPEPRTEIFVIPPTPTEQDMINLMVSVGKFLGTVAAHGLQMHTFTAGNAACTAIMNAAGTLEATAMQWQGFLAQQQAMMNQAGNNVLGGGSPMRPFLKN